MMSNNISIKESNTELIPILTAGTNGSNQHDRIHDSFEIAKDKACHQYLQKLFNFWTYLIFGNQLWASQQNKPEEEINQHRASMVKWSVNKHTHAN